MLVVDDRADALIEGCSDIGYSSSSQGCAYPAPARAAVALELGPGIEDLSEDVLDDINFLADAERAAEPILDVGRSREVIRVDVGLKDPLNLEPLLSNEGDELVRRLGRCAA